MMSFLPDVGALRALPHRPRPSHAAALHQALEARLLALAPARQPALAVREATTAFPPRAARSLPESAAQYALVGIAGALLLALVLVRGDGMFDGGSDQSARPFAVSREGSGRVELPAVDGETLVRVAINPAVSGANAWFWCIDADPPLPGADRVCASSAASAAGAVVSERKATFLPGRRYFAQAYCASACEWRIELQTLVSASSSVRNSD